jgi:DNA topoisomerase-1
MKLVIVESPAKGNTIEKYLGSDYRVLASFGHVRDLPKGNLGIEIDNNFVPKYVVPFKSRKIIKSLKDALLQAEKIYLATDYDREGEAIAWHIKEVLGSKKETRRITFTEITKSALQNAVNNSRDIDMHLVDAQQARRVLDRLVGYKLSPFLWKKVFKGLSAGRVQSVAVRLIVDREREIKAFKPAEYWTVGVNLEEKEVQFPAYIKEIGGLKIGKMDIKNQDDAKKIASDLENAQYEISHIEQKKINKYPSPPFTTSTLQQEASYRLYFSAKQTMMIAQHLYEAGMITYMRTDSLNISQEAISSIRKHVADNFGEDYLPESPKIYKAKSKGAQEAHEAIRPTNILKTADEIEGKKFDDKHRRLYELIRQRTLACQMKEAVLNSIRAQIKSGKYLLQANGSKLHFDGFMKVWPTKFAESLLPSLNNGDKPKYISKISEQHFTKPPARYSEANLVKALEEYGIGRPSTYAPIISTIQLRGYVRKEQGRFFPNESAFIVTDLLVENFPEIVDIEFTAEMEKKLDEVAENKLTYLKMIKDFYDPFEKNLEDKIESVKKINTEKKLDRRCPKCKKGLIEKMGRYGKFVACSGFPDCKFTEQILNKIGIKCPDCKEGDIIERKTRRGKKFWGCSSYPKCKWATWDDPKKKPPIPTSKMPPKKEYNKKDFKKSKEK